jgi:Cu-Zn family superoxide dismutase
MNRLRWIPAAAGAAILAGTLAASALAGGGTVHASAVLVDTSGSEVGWVRLVEDETGTVHLTAHADGLTAGLHGIHLHATGSCVTGTTPAFSSAGGHHNPLGAQHGLDNPLGAHAGDLPNLAVNAAGRGQLSTTTTLATLSPGPVTLFDLGGSAIVIHAGADDQLTDPTGNSGARVACGVLVAG